MQPDSSVSTAHCWIDNISACQTTVRAKQDYTCCEWREGYDHYRCLCDEHFGWLCPTDVYIQAVMFIFKWKRWTDLLVRNCPTGSIGHPSPNGWIGQDLFLTYLRHFVAFTKPSETNLVLLVIDGHQSHKSLRAVEFARQNHITILTLRPHSSHRLQPLDLTFFGPLEKVLNAEMDKWKLTHAAQRITDYDLCQVFTPAYQRVANVDKAASGSTTQTGLTMQLLHHPL